MRRFTDTRLENSSASARNRQRGRGLLHAVEALETRRLLAAISVTTNADEITPNDGSVSLREAITAIDAGTDLGDADIIAQNPGTFGVLGTPDEVHFDIAGGGAQTISPTSELPHATKPVIIDATTQPGFAGTQLITLDGSMAGGVQAGLEVSAPASAVRGFVVKNFVSPPMMFGGIGIYINNNDNNSSGIDVVAGNVVTANVQGIYASSVSGFQVGGIAPEDRNVASGNAIVGIQVNEDFSGRSIIEGNFVGVDVDGVTPLPNGGDGILNAGASASGGISAGSFRVGGSLPEQGNIIAYNHRDGIAFYTSAIIRGNNSIFSNDRLGINNTNGNPTGENNNDTGDTDQADFGAPGFELISTLQNHPVLISASRAGGNLTVNGILNSKPNLPFALDFFANPAPDPSGYGEGKTYLGSASVITDANGNASFSDTFASPSSDGSYISATATNLDDEYHGETSEFSNDVRVPVTITPGGVTITGTEGRKFSKTVASFTSSDPNDLASNYSVSINWGDATTSGGTVVSDGGGNFHVTSSHRYAEESTTTAGYPVTVTIHRNTGGNSIVTSHAKIADAPLDSAHGLSLTKSVNVAFTNSTLGSFRDQDSLNTTATDYTGTIDWGDGTAKTAAKFVFTGSTLDVGSFWNVQGSHKYTTKKTFTVKITLHDNGSPGVNLLITAFITVK